MASPGIDFRKGVFLLFLAVASTMAPWPAAHADDPVDAHFQNIDVDFGLKDKLVIQRVGSDRPHDGLLTVFAGFKNATDEALKIEVKTLYRDDIGDQVGGTAGWIGMQLPPRSETTYRSAAISSAAVDFVIRVRAAKS